MKNTIRNAYVLFGLIALCFLAIQSNAQSIFQPVENIVTNLPTVPLNQAVVIVDVGTVSQDQLWNNIRADYQFGASTTNTNTTSAWFLGAEVRNNLDTIGYLGATAGYSVFYHDVQFAPTLCAGYSMYHHAGEVDAMPLYLRYNLTGSVNVGAGAGWYWNFAGDASSLLFPKSGKTVMAEVSYSF